MNYVRAALLACLFSCARGLDVPAPSKRPVLTSFSPITGYENAVLTIVGKNFDPDPANNVVQFTQIASRAFGFDADGNLQAYVPDGNYSDLNGPISVTTPAGSSNPSDVEFVYLGHGHPVLATAVGTTRFLHRPEGVALKNGEVLIASGVAQAVISANGTLTALPTHPGALVGTPDLTHAFAAAGGKVISLGDPQQTLDLGAIDVRFLAVSPDSHVLYAVGVDPLGVAHLIGILPSNLTKILEASLTGTVLGLAALNDSRAVVVRSGSIALYTGATTQTAAVPAGALTGAVTVSGAGLVAAFADGTIRTLTTGGTPVWGAAVATGSPEPFATLVADGANIAGAKPGEGVVRVMDPVSGTIVATAGFSHPRALFWVPGGDLLVGDDAVNAVQTMHPADGVLGSRYSFPLGIGSSIGCGQGSMVEQNFEKNRYRVLVPSTRTNQLAVIDWNQLVPLAPINLAAGGVRAVVSPANLGIWVVHENEIGKLQDDDTEKILVTLPGTNCLLFPDTAGAAVVALRGTEADVIRGDKVTGTTTLPGTPVGGGALPDGRLVIFYGDPAQPGASPAARLYTVDALEHGGAPDAEFAGATRYQGFLGAFVTAWGPMLFFDYDSQTHTSGSYAVLLDAKLVAKPAFDAFIPEPGIIRLTPDGYFFVWQRRASHDNVLRILSAYELETIYAYEAYAAAGNPAMPAFDQSGEYMYVPVPELDLIQTFQ